VALTRVKNNQVDQISPAAVIDADLVAIGAISGTTGFLKKTAANTWALDSTVSTHLVGSGTVIQTKSAPVPAASGTTVITLNNTLPAISAGVQIWTCAITPSASTSQIYINGSFGYSSGTASRQLVAFLFRGNTCIASTGAFVSTASTALVPVSFTVIDLPATTSEVIYTIRVGGYSAQTWRINQFATAYFAGTLAFSDIIIQELA
jgi:hypothetical protein